MKKIELNLEKRLREPVAELPAICRKIAADGIVMLKNDGVLPYKKGETVSVFGRTAFDYLANGTGSGGLVHTKYKTNIIDGFRAQRAVKLYAPLIKDYEKWLSENPFDKGHGWATEPWYQKEYVLDEEKIEKAAANSDAALIVIGRLAGEDKDNDAVPGSYLLTEDEEELIRRVTAKFSRVAVALNVGNIIDMSFVEKYSVGAVLYLWQGGQEGGSAAADVLCGKISPSGKLPDTVVKNIDLHPAHKNFGSDFANIYAEDIYVGYRYFETFAENDVLYPFGFGLSYTEFDISVTDAHAANGKIFINALVKNIGDCRGREVVEIYYGAPNGKLGQPKKQLIAYKKTKLLAPGAVETVKISFPISNMKSYDDGGVTGHPSCYVMEAGDYTVYAGSDVRSAAPVYTYKQNSLRVIEKCTRAMAPVREFYRMKNDGCGNITYEAAPMRDYDPVKRIIENRPEEIPYTGDLGYKLIDVKRGSCTMEQFTAQIKNEDLAMLTRGEGMNSPKADVFTTAVFGGITETLRGFGISVTTNSDGPSGIRSDTGEIMTLMPNGTLLASTFDDEAVEEMFVYEGAELYTHHLDALLGPGINIHRHPCNGRNFEYFSEDPLLTGKMAAAQSRGFSHSGVYATPKHFAANSQEHRRFHCDSVVSERAIREIYLRAFEMIVKEGGAKSIMTSYNPINGVQSASNYDLTTVILRGEWGYDGFVMTDWGALSNDIGGIGSNKKHSRMIRAQNDIYMICGDTVKENEIDDILASLENGTFTRAELCRSCANLLRYIMNTPNFERFINEK